MIHSVTATNSIGYVYTFDMQNRIVTGFDVSGLGADVNYTETTRPGSYYQNTVLRNRELSLEVQLRVGNQSEEQMDLQRDYMYSVFNPELNPIRFDFQLTNGEEYYLTAYSLHAPIMRPGKYEYNAAFQRTLLQFTCTDPYIYQKVESRFELASYEGGLEFDWEIPVEGDEFETRVEDLSAVLNYPGSSIDGMTIKFIAAGLVSNPSITNVSSFDTLRLNYNMITGDTIEVSTYKGERQITLIRDGVRTNIFNSLSLPDSKFLQLRPGPNIFSYSADSGIENLNIVLDYRIRKVGV